MTMKDWKEFMIFTKKAVFGIHAQFVMAILKIIGHAPNYLPKWQFIIVRRFFMVHLHQHLMKHEDFVEFSSFCVCVCVCVCVFIQLFDFGFCLKILNVTVFFLCDFFVFCFFVFFFILYDSNI